MDTAKSTGTLETNLDGYDAGADSECATAMAEAVLRELSLTASWTRQSTSGRPSSADENPSEQSQVSAHSGEPRAAPSARDRIRLDPDLDFIVHDDGA